jgi:transcriptional regulator with XRE-family HTH domain
MRNESWISRQSGSDESRRRYEEERLIVNVFESLSDVLEREDLSKANLAKSLGTSRAHITQLFSGQRNVTLRTLANLAWACNSRVTLALEPLRCGEFIDVPVRLVSHSNPHIKLEPADADAQPISVSGDLAA